MPRRSLQILTLANVEPMLAATAPFEQKTRGGVNATAWLSLARLRAFGCGLRGKSPHSRPRRPIDNTHRQCRDQGAMGACCSLARYGKPIRH